MAPQVPQDIRPSQTTCLPKTAKSRWGWQLQNSSATTHRHPKMPALHMHSDTLDDMAKKCFPVDSCAGNYTCPTCGHCVDIQWFNTGGPFYPLVRLKECVGVEERGAHAHFFLHDKDLMDAFFYIQNLLLITSISVKLFVNTGRNRQWYKIKTCRVFVETQRSSRW